MEIKVRLGKPRNSESSGGGGGAPPPWPNCLGLETESGSRRHLLESADNIFEDTASILEVLKHIKTCTRG